MLAERIEAAAQSARRTDRDQLAQARKDLFHVAQDMRGMVGRAHSIAEQRRRLWHMGGGAHYLPCLRSLSVWPVPHAGHARLGHSFKSLGALVLT